MRPRRAAWGTLVRVQESRVGADAVDRGAAQHRKPILDRRRWHAARASLGHCVPRAPAHRWIRRRVGRKSAGTRRVPAIAGRRRCPGASAGVRYVSSGLLPCAARQTTAPRAVFSPTPGPTPSPASCVSGRRRPTDTQRPRRAVRPRVPQRGRGPRRCGLPSKAAPSPPMRWARGPQGRPQLRSPEREKARICGPFVDSGGRIRTCDLRVMSPTSYLAAPPRGEQETIAP